ncbi:DNA cytosine methyltransferase [Nocardia ninae]|uniref:DNA (cytosine-5-)-methyltransferase n=1 Tax=Nocardia ninae NBRC 108245 TaxID=1210091 RepID=A0A511MB73_9NOCA|nr:DNA cytosine methyltransferase [Nocardia ninae]GEM37006.1 DNA methylase [Nocardia ninae NBRC 108245]
MPFDAVDPARAEMIDLFAGPGGLDVAASWLGVPAVGIELDSNACATRRKAGLTTRQTDVRKLHPCHFPKARVLTAGPPCQTFSVAGSGAGRRALDQVLAFVKRMGAGDDVRADLAQLEDERTGLVLEPLRWALEAIEWTRPFEVIVLEQVPTVLPVWMEVGEALSARGYKVECQILRTEEFGVPQTRRRAVLIAHLHRAPKRLEPTHRKFQKGLRRSDGKQNLLEWRSIGDALGREDEFIVVSNYGTGGVPEARGERRHDEPAFTVTGKVSRNKFSVDGSHLGNLTTEDAGLLQTFPRDYPWSGRDIAQQIGNAIPPRLAAHVLCEAIFGRKPEAQALDAAVAGTWMLAKQGSYRLLPDHDDLELPEFRADEDAATLFDIDSATISK